MVQPVETKNRKIQFFRLVPHDSDKSHDVDWVQKLADMCSQGADKRQFEDANGRTFVFDRRENATVAIAKRAEGPSIQLVDGQHDIKPLLVEDLDSYLAFTTYAYLYPFNAFGLLMGAPGTPRASDVAKLANYLCPGSRKDEWQAQPMTEPGRLEEFKKLKGGVKKFYIRTSASPTDLIDQPRGLLSQHMTEISDEVGSQVDIELSIGIRRPRSYQDSLRRFRQVIDNEGLDELASNASKLQVTLDDQGVIDLVAHSFATTITIPVSNEEVDLSKLIAAIETVCAAKHDDVKQAVSRANF